MKEENIEGRETERRRTFCIFFSVLFCILCCEHWRRRGKNSSKARHI